MLRKVLSPLAHVVLAENGDQLLRLARSEPRPDMVILGTSSECDGTGLCRELQRFETTQAIPVLLIRKGRSKESTAILFEAGASDYVSLPIDKAALIARVETHLELKRLRELTATALALDALTEVADKRGVEEFIEMEWGRAAREATPLSLIMVRIDSFRELQEHRGRQAADGCLRMLAEELMGSIRRPMDFLGRYGEDSFAVVLPVTEAHGATYLSERMCEQVQFLEIPHPGSQTSEYVTISAGVATVIPFPGSSSKYLSQAALEGLERSISEGGNRVHRIELVAPDHA